jgi:hypothetical protein
MIDIGCIGMYNNTKASIKIQRVLEKENNYV